VERERLRVPLKSEEEYRKFFTSDQFDRLFDETVAEKLAISQITTLLGRQPLSTREISEILRVDQSEVARHLNRSAKQGLVGYDESRNCYTVAS